MSKRSSSSRSRHEDDNAEISEHEREELDYRVTFCAAQCFTGRANFGAVQCSFLLITIEGGTLSLRYCSLCCARVPVTLLAGLEEKDVEVDFGPQFNRASHPSDGVIEETWQAMLRERPRLWDAPKFRLAGVRVSNTPSSSSSSPSSCQPNHVGGNPIGNPGPTGPAAAATTASTSTVTLNVGLTSYKEYVATNTRARPAAQLAILRRDGLATHGDINAHASLALGVETVLQTSDGGVVLLRRSNEVALFGGVYNGPSGHPEPAHVSEAIDAAAAAAAPPDLLKAAGEASRAEIFRSVLQEVCDETGVPLTALSHPRLIGSMVDADGKPDLLFLTKTTLTAAEVAQTVRRGGASEAWESNAFAAVSATPPSDVEERSTAAVGSEGGGAGEKGGGEGVRLGDAVGLGAGASVSRAAAGTRGGGAGVSSSSATSAAAMAAARGLDASLTIDFWARREATMSPVTRAAVDCLYMLTALSSTAPNPPPHVWQNALDAAMQHRLDDVVRAIEQRNLRHLGCF